MRNFGRIFKERRLVFGPGNVHRIGGGREEIRILPAGSYPRKNRVPVFCMGRRFLQMRQGLVYVVLSLLTRPWCSADCTRASSLRKPKPIDSGALPVSRIMDSAKNTAEAQQAQLVNSGSFQSNQRNTPGFWLIFCARRLKWRGGTIRRARRVCCRLSIRSSPS